MRRISTWEKLGGGATHRGSTVIGKALQDLGLDCFAVYCTAVVVHVPGRGADADTWVLTLERAGFQPQVFTEETRHFAMMKAEHEIARQWSDYGIHRLIVRNPEAFKDAKPGAIPCADCKAWSFWKPKRAIGPLPEPRYMQLLTPEAIIVAKMPAEAAWKAYFGDPESEEDPSIRASMEKIQELTWGGDEE
jgi:hypothetical protein